MSEPFSELRHNIKTFGKKVKSYKVFFFNGWLIDFVFYIQHS